MSSDPLAWIEMALADLEREGLRRRLFRRDGKQATEIEVDRKRLVNFGSNDYLGLASDPRLTQSVKDSLDQVGWGSGASPVVAGRGGLHAELERELAEFEGTESALLFSSGYAANMGTIPALVDRNDVVFSDAKNHASIIDACRLSRARIEVYPHNDVNALDELMGRAPTFRRRLIVTDALFSMDGDLAHIDQLAEVAERHGAMLMVDEAHATGVFGSHGRGISEHLGAENGVHIRIGTLSKALGCFGGFVAGNRHLIDWLSNRARTYFFSTAPPEATCAAASTALAIVRHEPHRRRRLLDAANHIGQRLKEQQWCVGESGSQIIPVTIGDAELTMRIADTLRQHGFFAPGIRPPSVPAGESMLRVSISSAHSDDALRAFLDAMTRIGRKFRGDLPGR